MTFDPAPYRRWFPITENRIYINHAGTGPLSRRARQVIDNCLEMYATNAEFPIPDYFKRIASSREAIARFLGAHPEEITFTHSTSQGLYIALMNSHIRPGDSVIIMQGVFPAARYVADHNLPGVSKHYIPFADSDPIEAVQQHLHPKVKAVIVDLVHYLSGERIDIKRLGALLRHKGIVSIVDGIQAVGALDISIHDFDIDFLACGGAKWLFGPSGSGFLYVSKRQFPHLERKHTGWLGAQWTGFEHCDDPPPLYDDARMFEQGTRNVIGISALAENCRMLTEVGMNNVARHIQTLKQRLWKACSSKGYAVLTPGHDLQSGIITARPPGDAAVVYQRLVDNHVVLSLRSGWLRFSPHFYNTEEEIETVASLL
jgi:selenocysteine lyase/cysteine desulfurase